MYFKYFGSSCNCFYKLCCEVSIWRLSRIHHCGCKWQAYYNNNLDMGTYLILNITIFWFRGCYSFRMARQNLLLAQGPFWRAILKPLTPSKIMLLLLLLLTKPIYARQNLLLLLLLLTVLIFWQIFDNHFFSSKNFLTQNLFQQKNIPQIVCFFG